MENLNAEQVKKDLQNIVDNYSGSWTRFNILSNALALINSQEQRIKKLAEENERLRAENETLKVATNDQYAHICDCHDNIAEMLRQKEADTVRKMQEQLKMEIGRFGREGCSVSKEVIFWFIDQIAKEMLEGDDAGR